MIEIRDDVIISLCFFIAILPSVLRRVTLLSTVGKTIEDQEIIDYLKRSHDFLRDALAMAQVESRRYIRGYISGFGGR